MLFNHCDSESFQAFLDTLAEETPSITGRRVLLVMDYASGHKIKRLNWHHFDPNYLPARSETSIPLNTFGCA